MPNTTPLIIEKENYQDIRDLLGNASSSLLPDSLIERELYLGLAEQEIIFRVPTYADIIEAKEADVRSYIYLKAAVVGYCAALLTRKIQALVKSEDIQDYKYVNLDPNQWDDLRASLISGSQDNLEQLITDTTIAILKLDGPSRTKEQHLREHYVLPPC